MKYFCALSVKAARAILNRTIRYISLLFLVALTVSISGCSTKKKNFLSRGYHNLTAKYNVYWNGKESMKEGVAKLEKGHSDDYEEILEVFPIGTSETAKSVYTEMDYGIEKASLTIAKHSMLIKGKEYVSSIDDSYMLIGKAHFYKRDFVQALEMFTYVIKQYKKNKIRFDGYMWLIRTNTELARFKDAEKIITTLEEEKDFPKKKLAELAAVKADYYIKKGDYDKAKDQLRAAINTTKKRKDKSRYTYILAQLYEELNNNDSAAFFYTQVLRKNVPYVMEFNARINRALMASAESGTLDAIKRELTKMSKDEKNIDYFDRIFFALGDIAMKENEEDLALKYFKVSVASSTQNFTQKAVSYYTMADIYFDKPEYELASAYYDSSLAILPEKNKQYEHVKARQESLAELVKNIRIIARQDSLLRLGEMSETELQAVIADVVEKVRQEEEQRKFDEQNAQNNQQQLQNQNQSQSGGLSTTGSGWYFYNPTALSFGANNFRQKWGNRKNEDNWRRSNKASTNITQVVDENGDSSVVTTDQLLDPEYYLKDIPRTPEQQDSARGKIQNAYYDLGTIYKEQLNEDQRSINTFEELLKKYPHGVWTLETYYQLYRLYKGLGNNPKAQEYANRILREYPDSEYAKIIRDPKYLEKLETMRGRLGQMYDMAFENFGKEEYERVIEACDSALTKFKDDDILSKFALLKVMAIGATERLPVYRKALEDYIAKYTAAPEKARAEELLEYVKGLMGETVADEPVKEEEKPEQDPGYTYDAEAIHYYGLVVEDLNDLAGLKGRISNFNTTLFSTETLGIKNLKLSNNQDLIFVQGFRETKKAMDYYHAILTDTTVFESVELQKTSQFIISTDNFTKFYQSKDVPKYMEFFTANYLENKED